MPKRIVIRGADVVITPYEKLSTAERKAHLKKMTKKATKERKAKARESAYWKKKRKPAPFIGE